MLEATTSSIRRCARARLHCSALTIKMKLALNTQLCGCGLWALLECKHVFSRANKRRHRDQLGSSGRPNGRLSPNRPVVACWTAAVFRPFSLVSSVFSGQLPVRLEAGPHRMGCRGMGCVDPSLGRRFEAAQGTLNQGGTANGSLNQQHSNACLSLVSSPINRFLQVMHGRQPTSQSLPSSMPLQSAKQHDGCETRDFHLFRQSQNSKSQNSSPRLFYLILLFHPSSLL